MRTSNTHDKGALFGYDGQTMWVESTLDLAPAFDCEKCGPVVHQPIPEDESHCGCSGRCDCDCHESTS